MLTYIAEKGSAALFEAVACRFGRPFQMTKLRTMHVDAEKSGAVWSGKDDPRVTFMGRYLRRYRIDEIPQLWHVLRGQMSLVGPRPMTQRELHRYYGPVATEILQVKPGLAGLWQVSGRNRLTYAQRRGLDLQLVRGCSAKLYLRILLRTVPEIWSGSGSCRSRPTTSMNSSWCASRA